MQFVELDQRTDAWFEWRKNGITASESPVIVGLSPYQTLKTVESTLSQIRRRRARGTSGLWPSSP